MTKKTQSPAGRRPHAADSNAREQLLDAATIVFAERGIANTSVAQVAAAAGFTSAMVHYWFDTRERLLDALVKERLAPHFLYLWQAGQLEHETPIALIEEIVRRMFEITKKLPELPVLWMRDVMNEGGALREYVLRQMPMDRVGAFKEMIARGQQSREINPDIEPALLFVSILALVMLPLALAKTWRGVNPTGSFDQTTLKRHVSALLLRGITGEAAGTTSRGKGKSASNKPIAT